MFFDFFFRKNVLRKTFFLLLFHVLFPFMFPGAFSFLTKPNMTTSTAKVSIELNPSKCVSNVTLFDIGLQINALHVYYNMITRDNYDMPLRTQSCASVEKLALSIMERGTTKDFTETVWEECYQLPLKQLTATLQLVVKHITDFAQR